MLSGLVCVVGRVEMVAVRNVCVMTSLFVLAGLVMLRGGLVMLGGVRVMFGRLTVMLCALMTFCHGQSSRYLSESLGRWVTACSQSLIEFFGVGPRLVRECTRGVR